MFQIAACLRDELDAEPATRDTSSSPLSPLLPLAWRRETGIGLIWLPAALNQSCLLHVEHVHMT
ncbi:hypothetical protein [Aestuariivirga sp.]|jgi:hypothetical protein|uniref:hypothetical protein n=1 Tax=Aestuariivirga sp. TaxID=2650926 RepID=UPI0037850B2A